MYIASGFHSLLDDITAKQYLLAEGNFEWDAEKAAANFQRNDMSETSIFAKARPDGTVVDGLPDGGGRPFPKVPMRATRKRYNRHCGRQRRSRGEAMMVTVADPVLTRFRAALDEVYGERIERVVLFGSRARGDAHPESDYDVLVFLKDFGLSDRHKEMERISRITADIIQDTGEMISALPYPAGSYVERTPLMHEVRREGVDL